MNSFVRHYRARRRTKSAFCWRATMAIVLAFANTRGFAQGAAGAKSDTVAAPVQMEQSSSGAAAAPAVRPSGPIQYVGPDTFILLDSQGRPQAVPGMTYEDFMAAWKKLNQPAKQAAQPRYTIEHLTFDGQANRQRAELKLEAIVHLLADGPIDIPLGLVGTILQGDARFVSANVDGEKTSKPEITTEKRGADQYLDYDAQHGGFVAHLNGTPGSRETITLDLLVPLSRDGNENSLPLSCPRSTSSSLTMTIDGPVTEARATSGVLTSKTSKDNKSTRLDVAGIAGQCRVSWQTPSPEEASPSALLNAVGAFRMNIDGRGIRSETRLTVSSFGAPFDQFRVRLPRSAKLIHPAPVAGNQGAKYRITEESNMDDAPSSDGRTVIRVELKEKQQGPVVIELATEQPSSSGSTTAQLKLAGFEVIGAVRQFGDLALNVASDWQSRWDIGPGVRQVDPNEIDASLQRPDVTAAFQYDRQPWSLNVRVSPRQSRVHVTPQYVLELLPEEARLNVRLTYQLFGARTFQFHVDLDGWELTGEPVESGGLVDQDRVAVDEKGVLQLPVSQTSSRKTDISFSLRRALDRESTKIRLPLPIPLADSTGTGTLSVRVAPEIELLPDLTNSTGLATSVAESVDHPHSDNSTELHFRSLVPNAVFIASRTNRAREVATQINSQIDINADSVLVDERIEYTVQYEPIKELMLDADSNLPIGDGQPEITLSPASHGSSEDAGQRTPLLAQLVGDSESESDAPRRVRVELPQPQAGKFDLNIRYRIPCTKAASSEGTAPVSLLTPADGQFTSQRASVNAPDGDAVALNPKSTASSWKPAESETGPNQSHRRSVFVAARSESSLPLVINAVETKSPSSAIVERAWLQTWLANDTEQDRAVFRIRTNSSQSTVELPPNLPQAEIEVLVDGRSADVASPAPGRIIVALDSSPTRESQTNAGSHVHTVELRFRHPIQQSLMTRHLFTPPQIDGSTALAQVYWQIVLPSDEHIVRRPDQLSPAAEWQWLGTFCRQRPKLSQAELEAWVGASRQIAPTSENQYLFTGLLPISSIAVVTAPRWLIVLIASFIAMIVLATAVYLPVSQRRWLLIPLAVVLAGAAVAYPTAAILIAQASAIGVVLVPIWILLKRLLARVPRGAALPLIPASTHRAVTPRTESIVIPGVMSAASTAPTVALRASESER